MSKPTPADYKLIFEDNRTGALILDELLARFIEPAVTSGGIDAVLETYLRQGQRRPLDWILKRINLANQPTDSPPQPEVTE